MIRYLTAAVVLALAAPAAAQTPPASTGPYYIADADGDTLYLIASGTRSRRGDVGRVTAVVMMSEASQRSSGGVARLDMAYEFQCNARNLRNTRTSFYNPTGGLIQTLDNADQPWVAVSAGAASEVIMGFACTGALPADSEPLDDMVQIAAGYAEWSRSQ